MKMPASQDETRSGRTKTVVAVVAVALVVIVVVTMHKSTSEVVHAGARKLAIHKQVSEMNQLVVVGAAEKLMVSADIVTNELSVHAMGDHAPHWVNVPGRLKNVAISGRGDLWGVNSGDNIFNCHRYRGGNPGWTHVAGKLEDIAVNNAGNLVVGVNEADQIFYRRGVNPNVLGSGTWQHKGGALEVVGIGGGKTYGVNDGDNVFWKFDRRCSAWHAVGGRLKQISAHGKNVVGCNSGDYIFKYLGNNRWHNFPGRAMWASMGTDGTFWVLSSTGSIFRWAGQSYAPFRGHWMNVPGRLKQIDVANKYNIAGVNMADYIYIYVTPPSSGSSDEVVREQTWEEKMMNTYY